MKFSPFFLLPALLVGLTSQLPAETTNTYTYQWTSDFVSGTTVPDGNTAGWFDTRLLTGFTGEAIVDVNLTLNLTGGCNGDLYAYLSHGSGFSVLLNRPGRTLINQFGYDEGGLNILLDDSAANGDVHSYHATADYESLITSGGAWVPDGRNLSPVLNGFYTDPRLRLLSQMNTLDPNGGWTLFVADVVSGGGSPVLQSWGMTIQTIIIPEPSALLLAALGGIALLAARNKYR